MECLAKDKIHCTAPLFQLQTHLAVVYGRTLLFKILSRQRLILLYYALQIQSNILMGLLKIVQIYYFFRNLEPAELFGCYHSDFSPKNMYSTVERKKKHKRR